MSAQIEVPRTRNRSRKRPAIEAVEPVAEEPVEEGQAGSVVVQTGLAVLATGAAIGGVLRKMAKTRDPSTQAANDQKWMEDDEFLDKKFPSYINAVMFSGFLMGDMWVQNDVSMRSPTGFKMMFDRLADRLGDASELAVAAAATAAASGDTPTAINVTNFAIALLLAMVCVRCFGWLVPSSWDMTGNYAGLLNVLLGLSFWKALTGPNLGFIGLNYEEIAEHPKALNTAYHWSLKEMPLLVLLYGCWNRGMALAIAICGKYACGRFMVSSMVLGMAAMFYGTRTQIHLLDGAVVGQPGFNYHAPGACFNVVGSLVAQKFRTFLGFPCRPGNSPYSVTAYHQRVCANTLLLAQQTDDHHFDFSLPDSDWYKCGLALNELRGTPYFRNGMGWVHCGDCSDGEANKLEIAPWTIGGITLPFTPPRDVPQMDHKTAAGHAAAHDTFRSMGFFKATAQVSRLWSAQKTKPILAKQVGNVFGHMSGKVMHEQFGEPNVAIPPLDVSYDVDPPDWYTWAETVKSDPDKYYTNAENAPTLVPPMPDSAAVVRRIEAMITWAEMQRLKGISEAIMVQKLLRTDDGKKQLLLTYILTVLARNKHNTFDEYLHLADSGFDVEAQRQQDAGHNLRQRVRNRREEDVAVKRDVSAMMACDSDGECRLAKGQAIRVPTKQGSWVGDAVTAKVAERKARALAGTAKAGGPHKKPKGPPPKGKAWDSYAGEWVAAPTEDAAMPDAAMPDAAEIALQAAAAAAGAEAPPDAKFCHILAFKSGSTYSQHEGFARWLTICSDGSFAFMDLDHLGFKGKGPNPNTEWYYCKKDDENDCPPLTSTEADPKPMPRWEEVPAIRKLSSAGWEAWLDHFGGQYPVSPVRGAAPLPGHPPGAHWTTHGSKTQFGWSNMQFKKPLRFNPTYGFDPDTMRWLGAYEEEHNGRGWCKVDAALYERC